MRGRLHSDASSTTQAPIVRATSQRRSAMNRVFRELPACALALTIILSVRAQPVPEGAPNAKFTGGIEFVVKTFDQFPIVAIADLPACDEFHRFLRTLIASPEFGRKVHNIIVDFGNPLFQAVLDRYLMDGELMPSSVLRHVWDDTTESPDLTWDSPLYAEFFDTIRAMNLRLRRERRLRVVLGKHYPCHARRASSIGA